ncbi:hypothetical protein ACTQ49_03020 [Luteococcus sp. Sow4_B9]|uniref:hypothetical protein n=1 Tax=Luteococcus sp. Sow4_B9 TaxID=3438792 RepID=UPI003F95BAF1
MKSIKKIVAATGAMLAASSALLLSSPATAEALPTGCSVTGTSDGKFVAKCTSGTGEFRLRVICNNAPDRTSSWISTPGSTAMGCLVGRAEAATLETRN